MMESEDLKKSVTLRDIARELDISHATVSLALRDHARISACTRERVKRKADEMGYSHDPMLSALSYYRKNRKENPRQTVLAWINPLSNARRLYRQKEFNLYWKGAQDTARRLGLDLEEFSTEEYSLEQMDAVFKKRGIHGVVLAPAADQDASMDWSAFPWQDYTAIRFGRSSLTPSVHFVTSAQVSNAVLALGKMIEKGYRRIGFIGSGDHQRLFLAGYLSGQFQLPEKQRLAPLPVDYDAGGLNRQALAEWMKINHPDAILTDVGELPALLTGLGYSVPRDVGIATVSIHDTPIDAGIDQNPEEIGETVIRMLACLLNEHHFGIPAVRNSILVDGSWVDGSMLPRKT